MKEYKIKKSYAGLMWFMLFISGLFVVFGISIPYLEGETYTRTTIIVPAICTFIFIIPFVFIIKTIISMSKFTIVTDDDGLWYKYQTKNNGLIPWENICSIKERSLKQCLELYDSNKKKMIRIEYQLEGFNQIRDVVVSKLSKNIKDSLPREFKKEAIYKILNNVSCLLFIALAVYLYREAGIIYGVMGFIFGCYLIFHSLLISISKVTIDINCLYIHSPLRKRVIGFNEIKNISYKSEKYKGNDIHFVSLKLKHGRKAIKLNGLDIEPNVMFLSLKKYCK